MRKPLVLLCGLALVLAGCGGGGEESSNKEPAKQETAAGGGKTVAVGMKDIQFQPAEVTVAKKDGPGPRFSSGEPGGMRSGDTFQQKFDTPGTVQYVCTVHPNMEGSVAVK